MATLVHPTEMHNRIDTGCKGAVEPTTTLRNQFRNSFRHVSFSFGGLDVGQMPFGSGFGDQFEAENTIFGQEHVLLEDVHAFDTLLAQLL